MNVNLGESFDRFVEDLLRSGEYQSQSEIVREGLRLLKEREELRRVRIEEIKKQVAAGIKEADSGRLSRLDIEETKRRAKGNRTANNGRKRL